MTGEGTREEAIAINGGILKKFAKVAKEYAEIVHLYGRSAAIIGSADIYEESVKIMVDMRINIAALRRGISLATATNKEITDELIGRGHSITKEEIVAVLTTKGHQILELKGGVIYCDCEKPIKA